MQTFINSSFQIGSLTIPNRLIQGPLAGYSCAPFRELFNQFTAPGFCVSEMSSANDVLHKHDQQSRYIYRSPHEKLLAYQISGTDDVILAKAAAWLQNFGADLIDINCGCPKTKIRKKGAGSALLESPDKLIKIIRAVREVLHIPLTIKIRIQDEMTDLNLARQIEEAGADALIVHGRRWTDDYDVPANLERIAQIKKSISIPVIANGDIHDKDSLKTAVAIADCDAYMISRAGSGKPWLFKQLLEEFRIEPDLTTKTKLFLQHLDGLAALENEYQAVLQSKSLVRYYFRDALRTEHYQEFYAIKSLSEIEDFIVARISAV